MVRAVMRMTSTHCKNRGFPKTLFKLLLIYGPTSLQGAGKAEASLLIPMWRRSEKEPVRFGTQSGVTSRAS
jgi:hypothetical protein